MNFTKTRKFAVYSLGSEPQPQAAESAKKSAGKENGSKGGAKGEKAPAEPKAAKKEAQAPQAPPAPKSFARRDRLRSIELSVQKKWKEQNVYESEPKEGQPKYFLNFPYPYMNGRLHLGHAFSLTKAEFTARYQRLKGKNVLFPFAFHCTGMPIQAAANKLRDEMKEFGCPPVFPDEDEEAEAAPKEEKSAEAAIAAKSKGKKSKLIAKGMGKTVRQWDILSKMVPQEEIPSFADPLKWLDYFPPYGATDLEAFGTAIDWRRAFITTSVNPYYDAFIRWQFNRLKESNRIKFGKRANVYSILDGQVCADHDRSSGEGVGPQEYTIIKLQVIEPYPENSPLNSPTLAGKKVFLAPATLRPETMYGQTNCFVLPEGNYGAFEMANGDVLVISQRSANGMAHQGVTPVWGKAPCLVKLKGTDLLGLPLKAPNATFERVYTLPLLTISMGKGTGVVTSVPSDAPDDYAALKELQDKPLWREKFGLTAEMVDPYQVVPIIEIEGYGSASAVTMCERLDIKSSKDTEKLKRAKDEVYLKGFYEGVMLVGQCKGMKVCDAKPIIRQEMIESGDAFPYFEPESMVMSRTGEECIVALTDQWYLAYGEADWQQMISTHIHSERFDGYNDKIMEKFDQVLAWLKEWACSRPFGLGTKLPWDDSWVIESLSDSTIYMAYYTIAHYLQGNGVTNLDGVRAPNPHGIQPEDLTDDVFSFIFLGKPLPAGVTSKISTELLMKMRSEFEYWYPIDLRVSAKDLIPNHLTMCLYNHAAIWEKQPEMWPRSIYCNGHVMVDAEKMSKSKGNFLTLLECIEEFSADATRFACADAGDSMEDANFDRAVANAAITSLFVEEEWIKSVLDEKAAGKLRTGEMNFMDRCLNNEIDYAIEATAREFDNMCYREGIHRCWFDYCIARDLYRDWAFKCGVSMHETVITRFIEAMATMMASITPHWSENIWDLLVAASPGVQRETSIVKASWPTYTPYDKLLRKQYIFFRDFMKTIRQANLKVKNTGGAKLAEVYVASTFEAKRVQLLKWMQGYCSADGKFPADLLKLMKTFVEGDPDLKKDTKTLMQFGSFMRAEAEDRGSEALAVELTFDQRAILEENATFITKALDLTSVSVVTIEDEAARAAAKEKKKVDQAVPGKPSFAIWCNK